MIEDFEEQYAKKQALKRLKENIALFGRVCFPKAFMKATPPFHANIYKALRNQNIKKVLIAAPRGTAKSTVTSMTYPLHRVAFKPDNEEVFIVIISESQAQSINFLSRIKHQVQNSSKFKEVFGDFGPNTAKKWTTTDVVFYNGARIVAVGTGQRVRGFLEGDTRPTDIIVDDFESELNAYTPDARAKNRKWMTEAVIPSLSDEGRIIMIGTVISEDCFLYWAKSSPAWHVLWYSIMDDDGNSIWPQRFPMSRIEEIKSDMASVGNLNGFYQEYMNIAQSPDMAPFKPEWLKLHSYKLEVRGGQNVLTKETGGGEEIKPVEVYSGIDPASSLSARADYFVIATVALDYEGNVYIVDIIRGRIPPSEQPELIIKSFKRLSPKRMKIETVAYQEALRDTVRKMMIEDGIFIPGLERGIKPRGPKSARLLSMVPLMAKGHLHFRPQDQKAQEEFFSYPKGKHDDIMDALWMALDRARPCKKKEFREIDENERLYKKALDWMTM